MLTRKEAIYYDEQLHPAFAGYLFDGTITEQDTLAAIFHLLTKGVLEPVWEDGSMLKTIVGVKKTSKATLLPFNQVLVDQIFGSSKELSAKEIGKLIKEGTLKELIQDNLHAIAAFPIINKELKFTLGKHATVSFSVNGNLVDTVEEATAFKKLLFKLILPLFLGVGLLLISISIIFNKADNSSNVLVNIQGGSGSSMLLTGGIFVLVITLIVFSFIFSKKTVTYDLKDKVVPIAKRRYVELYEFIKAHPLPKHRFINEFLAFAIAFGFDDSWHKDFGLDPEIKVDTTPMVTA